MRVLIVGTGALGAFFGGILAYYGADVTFMARGERLHALQTKGLTVNGTKEQFSISVKATDKPEEPCDLALFCVKTYDTDQAARLMIPALYENSLVLPVQNGLTSVNRLTEIVGRPCVLAGVSRVSAVMTDLNVVAQRTLIGRIEMGEPGNAPGERAKHAADFLCGYGVDAILPPDIELAVWRKFLEVTSVGVGNVLTRLPLGDVMAVPESRDIIRQSLAEITAVGYAYNVNFAPNEVERAMNYLSGLTPDLKTSLLVDLEQGRCLEVEALSGAVVKLGAAKNIPTPLHQIVLGALIPHHLKALQALQHQRQ